MPKTRISEYSTTNSNNTDINSINIDEGCAPSGINNAIREVMVHLKNWQTNASGDGATFASLVVQGTGSFTGAVTMSAGATLSGTNTLSGSNIMSGNINSSGTNTFSGSQVISGNINSSGTTNTFSGGNILSGTNTLSGSTIISGNFNATGTTNTFSNALILGNNLTFTGTGNRITGDFSNATVANRVMFQTSTTNGNTVLNLIPNGTGTVCAFGMDSDPATTNSSTGALNLVASTDVRLVSGIRGTGTYLPMTFYTGGSERMRIDTSGNVGIGTTSIESFGGGHKTLEVAGSTNTEGGVFKTATSGSAGSGSTGTEMLMFTDSVGGKINVISSHPAIFYTANTERMRIDSSGNVGIGTSSPSTQLEVYNAGTAVARVTSGTEIFEIRNTGSEVRLAVVSADPMTFRTSNVEAMRITSGGEVYIAGTTDQGAYNLQCNGTGVWGAGAYVNGSDARIKEDVAPIDSGLDVVEKLNPVTYRYKEDWSKDQSVQTGFIAQELLVALDGKNYVDGIVQQGGAEGYYSVAYQNIIPILTKAIQELSAKNAALEARIAALESN